MRAIVIYIYVLETFLWLYSHSTVEYILITPSSHTKIFKDFEISYHQINYVYFHFKLWCYVIFSYYNIYLFELVCLYAPYRKTQNPKIRELMRYLIIISMKEEKLAL